jgi:hypothetical protein
MAGISTYLSNALLNATLRNVSYSSTPTVYLALYTTDPTNDDTGNEVSGSGYARKAITFTAANSRATANSGIIIFNVTTGSWGTITHWAIKDALTAGNLLYYGELDNPRVVSEDNMVVVPISDIDISIT